MGATAIRPETPEETLIYWSIVGTWGFYVLGGLYPLAPALAWWLAGMLAMRFVGINTPNGPETIRLPVGIWVWIGGMLLMAVALIIGHLNFGIDAGGIIKSFVGWMKGWALMALFPLIGATMRIRPQLIYRAVNLLGLQTLCLIPLMVLTALVHGPSRLYVSPLELLGGPGPDFFAVELYSIDDTSGALRWQFFAPWAPAAAFVGSIGYICGLFDRQPYWKVIGLTAALAVCLMSKSRLALVALPLVTLGIYAIVHALDHRTIFAAGIVATIGILLTDQIAHAVEDLTTAFTNARAASSHVRSTLQSIALHRWQTEAFWFGHGVVERGPKLVERMPIGSHHTWNGLLFVKGIVGYVAMAVPLVWSIIEMCLKSQRDRVAQAALGIVLLLGMFSFGENLEILAYLFWPGLLLIGIATRRRFQNPFATRLGK